MPLNRRQRRQLESDQGRRAASLPALLDAAGEHVQAGQYALAISLYEAALLIRADPAIQAKLGTALYNEGNRAARGGAAEPALDLYRRAAALRPGFAEAHANLVRLLLSLGRGDEALAAAMQAVAQADTPVVRRLFVTAASVAREPLPAAAPLLARAFAEGWARSMEVAHAAARLLLPLDRADPLLLAHLVAAPVTDAGLERCLTAARQAPADLAFRAAMARQSFLNEYVWDVTDLEEAQAEALQADLAAALDRDEPIEPERLALLACYRPLSDLPGATRLLARAWPEPVAAVLAQQVAEPAEERRLAAALPALTGIADPVSQAVRDMYEENPYPRWSVPGAVDAGTVDGLLSQRFPGYRAQRRARPDVLVAGCGTGQHAIGTARRFLGSRVLAVDLSRPSLGYAARMGAGLGIDWAQADILELGALDRRFDVVEASGVLHHMADPGAGLRVLAGLLRPAGVMRIGLYSALGRQHIAAARERITGLPPTLAGIRAARALLRALPEPDAARGAAESADFFTASTCRDLLFHVQEHRLTLPEVTALLDATGLRLLGFDVDAGTATRYRAFAPHDAAMTDLAAWARLEAAWPATFTGMYQFWVQAAS